MNNDLGSKKLKLKNISFNLFSILLPLLFLFPILKENLSTILIIVICVNTLIYSVLSKSYKQINRNVFLLTIPFWIIVCRSFLTTDLKESINHMQHALLFLIIPLFFSLIPNEFFSKKKINLYITFLKFTCLFIAIIYVIAFFVSNSADKFFIVFQHVSSFRNFVYYDFTLFKIHPTYYTTLLVFSSAHSFDIILRQKKHIQFLFILPFLIISILLLTRLNIVLMTLTLSGMVFLRSNLKLRQMLLLSGGILVLAVSIGLFTPGIKDRFVELFDSFNVKPENVSYDSTNIRRAIFDCSVGISKENFLFGVGFENLQNELNACYKENYDSSFYEKVNYMTHNYFFYILLSSGIFGLILFLFYLANIIKIALKSNNFLFYVFLFNVIIIWFTEDYLYRQYGILYFNLMLICFIRYSQNVSNETTTKFNID